jgi:CBS domain-containing protein
MTIASVLQGKGSAVETIEGDASLFDAVRRLGEKRIGALPVVDASGEIAGIMSERDVIYCLREHGPEVLDWPVSRVMSSPAITTDSRTDVLAALALMTQRRIRHLPVVEGGKIRGLVSIGDLVKYRMERIEAEADAMREYIRSA